MEKEYSQCLCLFSITEQNHLLFTDCLRFVEFMVVFFLLLFYLFATHFFIDGFCLLFHACIISCKETDAVLYKAQSVIFL